MIHDEATSAFSARIAKLLERVEYRRADTDEEKKAIYRFRYEAYSREGAIQPNESGLFTDPDDEVANVWLIGIYIDGVMASSVRLHVASTPQQRLPVTKCFPEIILPKLESGVVMIDVTRQTSRLEFTRAYPFLPYITIRAATVAEEYFKADYLLAACRSEYVAAFRRMWGSQTWAPPRPYPLLARPQALTGYDCKAKWSATRTRYPFMQSTPEEQTALFGRSSTVDRDLYEELTVGRRARAEGQRQQSTACVA